ncbi:ABC transporter permease [Leifsonia sp. AG29]|uniref:ABC transporter permease n=1 Tax=Leifsonia sp. AG29 TaxID=2598860 RepID=UPI00131BEC46|nr:FtsX-like permease family protein [Leifsonia sp. AG29]
MTARNGAVRAFRANGREHRSSVLVAALGSAFGVSLLATTNVLGAYIGASGMGGHGSVRVALAVVAAIFFVIAVYVGAIVTTNTFATIIAGRTRTIALLRLVGSSSRTQRRAVAAEGLVAGAVGSAAGGAIAAVLVLVAVRVLMGVGVLPDDDYPVLTPPLLVPPVIVVATTWLASWTGSRRVLTVAPIEALGAAEERPVAAVRSTSRVVTAIVLGASGSALLLLGLLLGLGLLGRGPLGVLVAFAGGILSFSGIVIGAPLFLPTLLRWVGVVLGRGAPGRLAAGNAVRNPERSSRTAVGLVIGVTLVTMFVVAASTWLDLLKTASRREPQLYSGAETILMTTMLIFSVLVGFSALIAAVGVVNSLSLAVLQRTRELGLLRALGFSASQVRRMVLSESVQLTVTGVATGLVLGVAYGWIGAQSLLGSIPGGGLLPPALPWPYIVVIVFFAAVLAVGASVTPARRATSVSPVSALAVE